MKYNDGQTHLEFYENKEKYPEIAKEFSENDENLYNALLSLWNCEIETCACCAGHIGKSDPYISIVKKTAHSNALLDRFIEFMNTCSDNVTVTVNGPYPVNANLPSDIDPSLVYHPSESALNYRYTITVPYEEKEKCFRFITETAKSMTGQLFSWDYAPSKKSHYIYDLQKIANNYNGLHAKLCFNKNEMYFRFNYLNYVNIAEPLNIEEIQEELPVMRDVICDESSLDEYLKRFEEKEHDTNSGMRHN